MAKFKGTFAHLKEVIYDFEVEADTKAEALAMVKDDPFNYIDHTISEDDREEQGLDTKDFEIEEAR